MEVTRKELQDLVIMQSPRIATHRIIPIGLENPSATFLHHCQYLSLDGKLYRNFVLCTTCENVFTNNPSNRPFITKHILNKHPSANLDPGQPKQLVLETAIPTTTPISMDMHYEVSMP